MKIAILLPGHVRSYKQTRKNIKDNLYDPLIRDGHSCLIFSSTWSNCGFRENNWDIGDNDRNELIEDSYKFEMEENKRDDFLSKYFNNKWQNYSHLSGPETCGDAVSMWYKAFKCFKLITFEDIDIVIKIRPDIYFDKEFDVSFLNYIQPNTIYMPIWHGKFEVVNCKMMDQVAFGTFDSMKNYCDIYENIDDIISRDDSPFTGEGFLYSQLKHKNINIIRCNLKYSLYRSNGLEKIV